MRAHVLMFAIAAACGAETSQPAPNPSTTTQPAPASASSTTAQVGSVAAKPGDPLEIRVRVTKADGSAAANTAVRLYHTDAEGYYFKNPDGTEAGGERARLAFATKTDGDGRFVVSTIVPARYPQGGPPAHVHLHTPPEHPDDLTIMLDHDPSLDRERVKRMLRTWIGRVRVDGARVILEADIVAP